MASLSQQLMRTAAIVPVLFTGCVTTGRFLSLGDELSKEPVREIVTTWTSQVTFSPDALHGGVSPPGISGRLYLFDQHGLPVVGDGGVTIELYDDSAVAKGGEAKLLELWKL